ncbi:MAG TPA: putative 2OG-Fe(II) oxygenase [Sphingomonas sp.]|nr:putative 2OG-Fe(II) oxygenase [Sphingomonas sp.]
MPNDYNLQTVAPFSPTILKATIPPEAVATLNAHADAILASPDQASARDWSRHLAGVVSHEVRVTDLIQTMPVFSDFLFDLARTFTYRCENALLHFTDYESTDELRDTKLRIDIKEGWINDMRAGDYNPVHFHQGCHFSSVGFLALPGDYDAEFAAGKDRQNTAGCLQFIDSRSALGLKNLFTVKPGVGDFYLWPSWMLHCVYPFKSEGIRRSIAVNLALG